MRSGLERSIPAINRDCRSELHDAPIVEQEEQLEDGEINDIPPIGLDLDSFVIGDHPPSPVNEGLFGIVQPAKRHYTRRPTIGLKFVELRPHWTCGAHQKRVVFNWLAQQHQHGFK